VTLTGRDRSTWRNPQSECHFFNHKCNMDWPGIERDLRDRKSVNNCLSHDAAVEREVNLKKEMYRAFLLSSQRTALSHTKRTYIVTSRDGCGAQDSYKAVYCT
jgi:hypothetical protein